MRIMRTCIYDVAEKGLCTVITYQHCKASSLASAVPANTGADPTDSLLLTSAYQWIAQLPGSAESP